MVMFVNELQVRGPQQFADCSDADSVNGTDSRQL